MSTETHDSTGSDRTPIRQLSDTHRVILLYLGEYPDDPHLRYIHDQLVEAENTPYTYPPEFGSKVWNGERWDVQSHMQRLEATGLVDSSGRGRGWHLTNVGKLVTHEIERAGWQD